MEYKALGLMARVAFVRRNAVEVNFSRCSPHLLFYFLRKFNSHRGGFAYIIKVRKILRLNIVFSKRYLNVESLFPFVTSNLRHLAEKSKFSC